MKKDEFGNRYIIKLASSLIIAVVNVVIQLIIPRALSVEEYGYYTYNLNVFTSIVTMFNLSASNALVAKFSKRNDDMGLVYFYVKFFSFITAMLCIGIIVLSNTDFFAQSFSTQTIFTVLLALVTALVIKAMSDVVSIYDASAISRVPAIVQVIVKVLIFALVSVTYIFKALDLNIFYIIQIMIIGSAAIILLLLIIKEKRQCRKTENGFIDYAKEYYIYCKPLVVSTVINQLVIVVMNWSLMRWSGSTEQAMFGAAWQFNIIIGYVFSPYAELLKREFAVVSQEKEKLKVKFSQSLCLMNVITSYFAMYIAVNAEGIIPVLYGDKYKNAGNIVVLIMIYTVFQAVGQLSGSYMLALERTKLTAILAVVNQVLSLLFVFVFQIPNIIWETGLGAIGIAINYLLVNIIGTQLQLKFITKELGIKFKQTVRIQFTSMGIVALCAIGISYIMTIVNHSHNLIFIILSLMIEGVLYTLILGCLFIKFPTIFGFEKEQVIKLMQSARKKLKRG